MVSKISFILIIFCVSCWAISNELVSSSKTKSTSAQINNESQSSTSKYEPYFEACVSKDQSNKDSRIEAISPLKFGVPQIAQSDEKGQSAFDLVNEAYKAAQARLKSNLEKTQKSLKCIDEVFDKNISEISQQCHSTFQEVQESSIANQRARYALAIALPDKKTLTDLQYMTFNPDLNIPISTFKNTQWNPLSISEKEIVSKSWKDFLAKTDQEVASKVKDHFNYTGTSVKLDFKKNLIQNKRKAAMMSYHLDVSRYPLIQFLKSDQPQKEEYKTAYSEVIKNIQNEMENIKSKQNSLVLNPLKKIGSDDLFILNYQTTEDLLSAQPKYCSIAQSLIEFQKKKQMYISAGSALAFVGASLTGQIPVAVIFATGSALSGFNTYESYAKYKADMQAHLTATNYDEQILRKDTVDKDKNETVVQGALTLGSAALSIPFKTTQLISQAKVPAQTHLRELIEGEPFVIQALSVEKKLLIQKINSLEKDALQAFNQTGSEILSSTGRGIGKEVTFKVSGGVEGRGFILKHVFEDEATWTIVGRKAIIDGKVTTVKIRVPAMDTLPVKNP